MYVVCCQYKLAYIYTQGLMERVQAFESIYLIMYIVRYASNFCE